MIDLIGSENKKNSMIRQLSIERLWLDDTINDLIDYSSKHLWMKAIGENINPHLKRSIHESNNRSFHTVRYPIRRSIRENIEGET